MVEQSNMLQRMRELAVQAMNGTYSDVQRGYLNNEFQALGLQIDRIATEVFGDDAAPIRKPSTRLTTAQPGFDITPRMKEQARIGMPLFSESRRAPADNLQQWLGNSKVRTVMYHGTARDISTFRPQQADAIFLTDNPEFAANFADMSHSWMVNNYWTWMTPDQIQQAKMRGRSLALTFKR